MSKPDTAFPKILVLLHIALTILLIVAAVALALKLYSIWE